MKQTFAKYFEGIENQNLVTRLSSLINREDLPLTTSLPCLIAGAQAAGEFEILKSCLRWALDSRVKYHEIYEILLQGHLFLGYPKALESFFVLNDAVINAVDNPIDGLISPEDWDQDVFKARGFETARNIYSKNFDLVYENIGKLSPELAQGMIFEGYGRIISRPGADLILRELAIVSVLTVSYMPRQLYSHVRGAFNVGASRNVIHAVIELCGIYCSEGIIENALLIMEKSLGKSPYPK